MRVSNDKPKEQKRDWHTEFKKVQRIPRPAVDALKAIFADSSEPKIFLREGSKSADVVVRFTVHSPTFPQKIRESSAERGLSVSKAFDEVVWLKAGKDKNTIWAELRKLGSEARRLAWLRFFRLSYLGHYHPEVDAWLKGIEREIDSARTKAISGRPHVSVAETTALEKRFRELLRLSSVIHEASRRAAQEVSATHNSALIASEARRRIWTDIKQAIYADRHDDSILTGKAFHAIPCRPHRPAQLHVPASWKPPQLAISLLSSERGLAYETVGKKLASISRQKRVSKGRK